jgi:hypothetical protein
VTPYTTIRKKVGFRILRIALRCVKEVAVVTEIKEGIVLLTKTITITKFATMMTDREIPPESQTTNTHPSITTVTIANQFTVVLHQVSIKTKAKS